MKCLGWCRLASTCKPIMNQECDLEQYCCANLWRLQRIGQLGTTKPGKWGHLYPCAVQMCVSPAVIIDAGFHTCMIIWNSRSSHLPHFSPDVAMETDLLPLCSVLFGSPYLAFEKFGTDNLWAVRTLVVDLLCCCKFKFPARLPVDIFEGCIEW